MSVKVEISKAVYQQILHAEEHPLAPILKEVFPLKNVGVVIKGDKAFIDNITDYSIFTLQALMGIISVQGQVYNYPVFIEVPKDKYDTEVPAFLPSSVESLGDDGQVVNVVKWSDYKGENVEHMKLGESHYVENDGHGGYLLGSQIAGLIQAGYKVYTLPDFQALIDSQVTNDGI